jgi:hypothetical protein
LETRTSRRVETIVEILTTEKTGATGVDIVDHDPAPHPDLGTRQRMIETDVLGVDADPHRHETTTGDLEDDPEPDRQGTKEVLAVGSVVPLRMIPPHLTHLPQHHLSHRPGLDPGRAA